MVSDLSTNPGALEKADDEIKWFATALMGALEEFTLLPEEEER